MNDRFSSTSESEPEQLPPTFDVLPLSPELRRAVDELGFKTPTPVQRSVFGPAAARRDLVVQARTGTGKTAAFGLPVLDRLVDRTRRQAQVLVLSPTRELALQITREISNLAKYLEVETVAIYGGAAMDPQVRALKEGAQIVVGTPGRVLDHLERGTLDASSLKTVILDESDEMLSMGFLPQINAIFDRLPPVLHTLLFSATVPPDVRRIAESRLKNPEFITLSGDHIGALSIEHYTYPSRGNKADELIQIITVEQPESAIVFCNTREQTKRLAHALQKAGFSADWLNADLSQSDRERVMAATRASQLRFLVATDVAARGIDISHLTHVINADFPESTETYVHRTGRTGRAGRTGQAISLITPQDVGNLYLLRLTYRIFPTERALPRPEELRAQAELGRLDELRQFARQSSFTFEESSLARRLLADEDQELLVALLLRAAQSRRAVAEVATWNESRGRESRGEERKESKTSRWSKERRGAEESRSNEDRAEVAESSHSSLGLQSAEREERKRKKKSRERRAPDRAPEAGKSRSSWDEVDPVRYEIEDDAESANLAGAELAGLQQLAEVEGETLVREAEGLEGISANEVSSARSSEEDDYERVFVSVGRRDAVRREDIEALLDAAQFPLDGLGSIKIKDHHSFVQVRADLLESALLALDGSELRGATARAEKARPRQAR